MNKSDGTLKEWQVKWRCKLCKDEIYSRYAGEFVSCGCRAIAVDQTPYYSRYIGSPELLLLSETGESFADIREEEFSHDNEKTSKE